MAFSFLQRLVIGSEGTRRDTLWRSRTQLVKAGWSLSGNRPVDTIGLLDFLARREDVTLAAMTSGTDRILHLIEVRDFCRAVRTRGFEPLFIHGEQPLSCVLVEAQERRAILLPGNDVDSLPSRLSVLPIRGRGWIESLGASGRVTGWVRLSPTPDKAEVTAFRGGDAIGRTTADLPRPDMAGLGDARFGFHLQLPPMAVEEFLAEVKLIASHHGQEVCPLQAIDGFLFSG